MKILYLTLNFRENAGTLYTDLISGLLERGHEVTVVRSKPESDTALDVKSESFRILNVKTPDPFAKTLIKKAINQFLLTGSFKRACKKFLNDESFDLILYATPPVTLANLIIDLKKKYRAKTFLMLKDIFPQNAVDLGFFKKRSLPYLMYREKEEKYYKISDWIGCMSEGNKKHLIENNPKISHEAIYIFPNSISTKNLPSVPSKVFNKQITFMFGGNLGKPQAIKFLLAVAEKLINYEGAHFCIVGKGTESDYIKNRVKSKNLRNVTYKDRLPQKEYEELLSHADVGLICLDHRFTIPNIPSRLQAYLKLAKPILAFTDRCTDLKDMIENNDCGWWAASDEVNSAAELVKHICEHPDEITRKASHCQDYLRRDFDVMDNVRLLEKLMK